MLNICANIELKITNAHGDICKQYKSNNSYLEYQVDVRNDFTYSPEDISQRKITRPRVQFSYCIKSYGKIITSVKLILFKTLLTCMIPYLYDKLEVNYLVNHLRDMNNEEYYQVFRFLKYLGNRKFRNNSNVLQERRGNKFENHCFKIKKVLL